MANVVVERLLLVRVFCLMALFSFSHSSVVIDGGKLASQVANLEAKFDNLAAWSEDHPFVRELVKRIEQLELKTTQQAEKITILESKSDQQLEKDIQNLNNTIAEQGVELAQAQEKLESLEKDVNTKTFEIDDDALVVNLSDYKGGRLTVETTYGRILAFQPGDNSDSSLQDALKFIKIFDAKDGTHVTLNGNNTLNPDVRHSGAAYETMYAESNQVVLEFSAEIPDGKSIQISKAVECPKNLGALTQCARVVDAESCYCAVFTQRTWQEQNAFCQSNGFSLLTLESAEEENAVTTTWGSIAFWMSLNDLNTEGTWIWDASGATLDSLDYVNWAKGEPNDVKGEEDCVEWKLAGSGWNDNRCNARIGAICERQPTPLNKVPRSCADLRLAGQSVSGLYQVQTNDADGKKISTVFCDMSEDIGAEGFETIVGVNDVKSIIVHFSVARKSDYEGNETVIPYEIITLNNGNAMNATSGVFTAPVAGIYSFTFNFVNNFDSAWAFIRRNGNRIRASGGGNGRNSVSTHVKVILNAGDRVDTYLYSGPLYSYNFENAINFSGSLLVEF